MESASAGYAVHGSPDYASVDVEIPEGLDRAFEALPETQRWNVRDWEEWEDKALVKYWPVKIHSEVAKLLGVSVGTALKRYRQLTEKKSK